MALDEVADELYGLPPGEFVAARNAAAKEAKAAGDRDLAAAITALAKPTKAAWLVNQLVRARRDEVRPLLELGAGLREATAALSGEDLRRLTKQQGQLVHALVQQAKALAGGPVTEDVTEGVDATLRAALADADLAAELLRGRLTDRLAFAGFGGLPGLSAPQPVPAAKAKAKPKVKATQSDEARAAEQADARRQALEESRRLVAEARTAADGARAASDAAVEIADQAAAAVRELAARLDELRAELERVTAEHGRAEHDERTARVAMDRTGRAAAAAERRLAQAEQALEEQG